MRGEAKLKIAKAHPEFSLVKCAISSIVIVFLKQIIRSGLKFIDYSGYRLSVYRIQR